MSEVDGLILLNLQQLGYSVDVASLGEFDADAVYSAVHFVLARIDEEKASQFPESLPRATVQRMNACTKVAAHIRELGYRNELSYHQLMYPTSADTRKLLAWLTQAVPSKGGLQAASGSSAAQAERASQLDVGLELLGETLKRNWVPRFVYGTTAVWRLSTRPLDAPLSVDRARLANAAPSTLKYYETHLPLVSAQPRKTEDFAGSVFESNANALFEQREREEENARALDSGLNPAQYRKQKLASLKAGFASQIGAAFGEAVRVSNASSSSARSLNEQLASMLDSYSASGAEGSRFERQKKFEHEEAPLAAVPERQETEEEREAKRAAEIQQLEELLARCESVFENMATEMQQFSDTVRQSDAKCNELDQERVALTREYKLRKMTFDMLPDYANNKLKLEELVKQTSARLIELASEWEKFRVPLLEEYRRLLDAERHRSDQAGALLEQIKQMRAEMKQLIDEIHNKDEQYKQLHDQFSKLPKDVNRSIYTKRIMEIVKNVKKQKVDIDKILLDTRNLQKEINRITESLGRSFTETDELVFSGAKNEKKDNGSKQAYKDLVFMHQTFEKLTSTIEETGRISTQILDIGIKIEQLQTRTSALNVDQVEADLKEIRDENAKLIARVKSRN
jgi:hypothetical protein